MHRTLVLRKGDINNSRQSQRSHTDQRNHIPLLLWYCPGKVREGRGEKKPMGISSGLDALGFSHSSVGSYLQWDQEQGGLVQV